MRLITPSSLLLGLLLASPGLWQAFNEPGADITGPLVRFVLAVIVAGAGLSFLRGIVGGYQAAAIRREQDAENTITTMPPATGPVIIASDEVLPA
ncbi:MAG: hypothetical protein AB7O74_09340 [Candidatus Nanopelagicales bacterium]